MTHLNDTSWPVTECLVLNCFVINENFQIILTLISKFDFAPSLLVSVHFYFLPNVCALILKNWLFKKIWLFFNENCFILKLFMHIYLSIYNICKYVCTAGQKQKKKKTPINSNTYYRREMKFIYQSTWIISYFNLMP